MKNIKETDNSELEMDKKPAKNKEKLNMKEAWNDIVLWANDHKKILMPAVLVVFLIVTVLIAVNANKKGAEASEPVAAANAADVTMELDAHPEVNTLINAYYGALASGDAELAATMNNNLTETEKIYITQMGKLIDSFTSIEVYTKPGPVENSYLAYVYYSVKFIGSEVEGPGMTAYYVCADDEGKYYINEGNESEEVTSYIEEMSIQDDVVDLNNRVSVAFNDLMANDEEFQLFYSELITQLDVTVGEELAKAQETASANEAEQTPDETEEPEVTQPEVPVVTKVETTDGVNVRSSASTTADRIGQAKAGDVFEVVKVWENGWTQIVYEGKDGYIKSDYLKTVEETTGGTTTQSDTTTDTVIGTVKATTTVNVRATASATGEKLGVIYQGETLELIQKQADGWSKVKYKNQTGYVKTEYVE